MGEPNKTTPVAPGKTGKTDAKANGTPSRRSCDICRKRKTKCYPVSENDANDAPCSNCSRLKLRCSYSYVYKRPGRPPNSSTLSEPTNPARSAGTENGAVKRQASQDVQDAQHEEGEHPRIPSPRSLLATSDLLNSDTDPFSFVAAADVDPNQAVFSPSTWDSFMLSRTEASSTYPDGVTASSHRMHESHQQQEAAAIVQMAEWTMGYSPGQVGSDTDRSGSRGSATRPLAVLQSGGIVTNSTAPANEQHRTRQQGQAGPTATTSRRPTPAFYLALRPPELQIDDVSDWSTISFFTSLFLQYNHSLCPLTHTPSLAKALATRRDKHDRQFRAFVLGLVTYTIGQSPIGRLTELCPRSQLEKIQKNCHRASMLLHDRKYEEPSLHHIGTLIFGHFFCQSNSYTNEAATLLAEACQVSHLMKLHEDVSPASFSADFCEMNLRRRVFWYLFAIDITEASAGLPIHLHEHDGYPASYPLEISDDLITSAGAFPQTVGRISAMTGFVACVKMFVIMAGCLGRRRAWGKRRFSIYPLDVDEALAWISQAEQSINALVEVLPPCLAFVNPASTNDLDDDAFHGMQRANLVITALSVRFLLCSYKADVQPLNTTIILERDALSRQGIHTLAGIPMDDLAANGESMRGKIFRILLALLDQPASEGLWDPTMEQWWSMYANVQFVQLVIPKVQSVLPSREGSPT